MKRDESNRESQIINQDQKSGLSMAYIVEGKWRKVSHLWTI